MKTLITIIAAFISLTSNAQCSDSFFPFEKDKTLEYTEFNQAKESQGTISHQVTSSSESLAMVKTTAFSKSGKELEKDTYAISCDKGDIQIDVNQYIPSRIWKKFKEKKKEIEGNFIVIPKILEVNQKLPEGNVTMTMEGRPRIEWKVKVYIKDRQVKGKEELTTPAGTFETFVIEESIDIGIDLSSLKEYSSFYQITWYSKNNGIIKKERYGRKEGPLLGYSLLTKSE
ncbi:TapB family protein [Ekhidna sp.]